MRLLLVAGVLAWVSGCTFNTHPTALHDAGARAKKSDAGAASGHDAGAIRDAGESLIATMDASPARDSGQKTSAHDAAPLASDAASDAMPAQNGGLMCNGVFCPFATDPIKPCCTSASDVEQGAARSTDRCGLDFSATGRDFFSTMCWQRDQTGVLDPSCPDVAVDLHTQEPGCCTDQGRCGGLNTDHAIGCHYDPAAPAKSCGATVEEPDGGVSSCDPTGVFGMRLEVDLAWGGRTTGLAALTDDGRGTQVVYLLANIDDVDPQTLELHGQVRACGVQLPTFFSTTLCEAYEPIFPTTIWTSKAMPSFTLNGRFQCLEAGCIASYDAQTFVLGIELANPEAPWPTSDQTQSLTCSSGKGAQCFPDQDGDGQPGLGVQVTSTGSVMSAPNVCSGSFAKRGAPLNASIAAIFGGVRRTDRVELGVRMKIGGSQKLSSDCGGGKGVGIAEFVNSRGIGCTVEQGTFDFGVTRPAGANEACTASEAAFMDANLPIYSVLAVGQKPDPNLNLADKSPSTGPQMHVTRLGDANANVSCDDVRAAMFP